MHHNNGIQPKAADLKVSNIAANNRKVQQSQSNLDNAWGNFENAVVGEINDADGTGEIMLMGWFATREQALNEFTGTAKVEEVNIRKLVYKGKSRAIRTNASGEPAKRKIVSGIEHQILKLYEKDDNGIYIFVCRHHYVCTGWVTGAHGIGRCRKVIQRKPLC